MSTARTARVYRFDEPGTSEKLRLREEQVRPPGHGHVRVQVQALSLNQADTFFLANKYIETPEYPSKLGYEISGVVESVGSGITKFRVGDRVSSIPAFSVKDYGNFGELTVLPERGLMLTPENLDEIQGASFSFAYFTNYFGLFTLAKLEPFQTVLITAATSTTGFAAIAIARQLGATVIATSRTSAKKQILLDAGAHHVIATGEENLVERVKAIAPEGVDIAYDCIAGSMSEDIVAALRPNGQWVVYGLMDLTPSPFPWMQALIKNIQIHLYMVFGATGYPGIGIPTNDRILARGTDYVKAAVEKGGMLIKIDKVFQGIESLPEAIDHMVKGTGAGKIVVKL